MDVGPEVEDSAPRCAETGAIGLQQQGYECPLRALDVSLFLQQTLTALFHYTVAIFPPPLP